MKRDGKATALARSSHLPQHAIIAVHEESAREPLGPRAYRDPFPPSTTLIAEWRWFSMRPKLLGPFLLVWCALVWSSFFYRQAPSGSWEGVVKCIFGLLSLYCAYRAVAIFVNRTTLRVSDREVTIRHGPLPWPGRHLAADSIESMFCQKKTNPDHQNEIGDGTYELWVARRDGSKQCLLDLLPSDSAYFLEGLVEKRLALDENKGENQD